jgi:aromatic ring-opening dioxygenase catalytic subunit (LigB family)
MPSTTEPPPQPYPAYFIGHAGVGLLFNESLNNKSVQANLREIGKEILSLSPRPKAIVVFSGHFEAGEIHGPGVIEGKTFSHSVLQLEGSAEHSI